jgi:hypothetical protein
MLFMKRERERERERAHQEAFSLVRGKNGDLGFLPFNWFFCLFFFSPKGRLRNLFNQLI